MAQHQYTLLLVDDEEKHRSIIKILLGRGYPDQFLFLEASTAKEGQALLERHSVDGLIVDIHMPGKSGLDWIKELRSHHSNLYIMVLSAYNYFEYAKEALRYQVNHYILKPPIKTELYEAVDQLLEHLRSTQAPAQLEETSRSVIARELGKCFMLHNDHKKIDAFCNILQIDHKYVFCMLVNTKFASQFKLATVEEELEEVLQSMGIVFGIHHMLEKTAVFCFTDQPQLGYTHMELGANLKLHLEIELCEKAEVVLGSVTSIYQNPAQSYQEALSIMGGQSVAPQSTTAIEELLFESLRKGDMDALLGQYDQYLLAYNAQHSIDEVMLKAIGILTYLTKSAQVAPEEIRHSLVEVFATGDIHDMIFLSGLYLRELDSKTKREHEQERHHVIRQICDQVRKNVAENWTIESFAREFGYNPFTWGGCSKRCTRIVSQSFWQNNALNRPSFSWGKPP